jgi:hypothetical protein
MIGVGRTAPAVEDRAPGRPRFGWIYGVRADLFVALCWIPIFLFAHSLSGRHGVGSDHLLNNLFNGAFLLSLVHQPLTLALVYGDRNQFALRRRLFTWSPVVAVPLIAVAVALNLWVIIPIAAVWNTIHTLQQRYGLSRIYARKAGYGSARLDRAVLYTWMAAAILAAGSSPKILDQLSRVMLGSTNSNAIVELSGVRSYALWLLLPALLVAAAVTVALARQETEHVAEANHAKWLYQVSSLALIATIAFDPLAGFIAYVAAHAIEYFVVVYKTVQSRYGKVRDESTVLGRLAYRPAGRLAFFTLFVAAFLLLDTRFDTSAGQGYTIALYSIGILHFWYDSFIWKLRRPAVAANFGIAQASAA